MDEERYPEGKPDEERHPEGKPDGAGVTCARCGRTTGGETVPPTWVCSVEDGRRQYVCDECARAHIRSIESRLDFTWW
ncbi:hypothetical protein ABZ371_13045 [Streptomyces sp. NPDC005899]|uniref:hypothetical protein n=1 Tax=Streptomyces sp. NPDC005899 TaxID=3155716 RepID=UPI0033DE7BF9